MKKIIFILSLCILIIVFLFYVIKWDNKYTFNIGEQVYILRIPGNWNVSKTKSGLIISKDSGNKEYIITINYNVIGSVGVDDKFMGSGDPLYDKNVKDKFIVRINGVDIYRSQYYLENIFNQYPEKINSFPLYILDNGFLRLDKPDNKGIQWFVVYSFSQEYSQEELDALYELDEMDMIVGSLRLKN